MSDLIECIIACRGRRLNAAVPWRAIIHQSFRVRKLVELLFASLLLSVFSCLGAYLRAYLARRRHPKLVLGILFAGFAMSVCVCFLPETLTVAIRASVLTAAGILVGGFARGNIQTGSAGQRAIGAVLVLAGMALGAGLLGGPFDLLRPFSLLVDVAGDAIPGAAGGSSNKPKSRPRARAEELYRQDCSGV